MADERPDDVLHVEMVAADRVVWSGDASIVVARTTDGDVGVMREHSAMFACLVPGVLEVRPTDGEWWIAAVDGGFLSVAENRVSILVETAEMAHDIDVNEARKEIERAREAGATEGELDTRYAEARIRAVEQAK